MNEFLLGEDWLSARTLVLIADNKLGFRISDKTWEKVDHFRTLVDAKLERSFMALTLVLDFFQMFTFPRINLRHCN